MPLIAHTCEVGVGVLGEISTLGHISCLLLCDEDSAWKCHICLH